MKQTIGLTEDLLDALRIGRGRLELRTLRVALSTLVNMAVEAARPLIDKTGQQLTVKQPEEPLMLEADPTRLTQVLVNLLNNASRFSPASGHIWLTVEKAGNEALVRVGDNGFGIAEDEHSRIFEMFAQATHSSQRTRGGLGIGLSLVNNVIRTNRIPFIESRASWPLILTSIIIVAVGTWLTVSPLAKTLGFVPLPPLYWLFLAIMLLGYAILTQVVKTWSVRRFGE